jgi:hypothetical protein
MTDWSGESYDPLLMSLVKPVATLGAVFSFWGEKNVPVLNRIFCQDKMLEYAYNWQLWIENTNLSKTVKILSVSITELMLQA